MRTAIVFLAAFMFVFASAIDAKRFDKADLQCDLCQRVAEQPQHWIRRMNAAKPHEMRGVLTDACHNAFHADRAKTLVKQMREARADGAALPNLRTLDAQLPQLRDVTHACRAFVDAQHPHGILRAARIAGATAHVGVKAPQKFAAVTCAHLCK